LFYLLAADDWEYTDFVSLASVVAYQTGNPSCMGSEVHQTLNTNSHTHVYLSVSLKADCTTAQINDYTE